MDGGDGPAAEPPRVDIDYAEIQRRIPHRYPFLLVDKCEDYRPRESVVGIKCGNLVLGIACG